MNRFELMRSNGMGMVPKSDGEIVRYADVEKEIEKAFRAGYHSAWTGNGYQFEAGRHSEPRATEAYKAFLEWRKNA